MPLLASRGMTLEIIPSWIENGMDICEIGSLLTKGDKEGIAADAKGIREMIDKTRR